MNFHKADPRWWECERKKKHNGEPAPTNGMKSYKCRFCDGWHRATAKGYKVPQKVDWSLCGGYLREPRHFVRD